MGCRRGFSRDDKIWVAAEAPPTTPVICGRSKREVISGQILKTIGNYKKQLRVWFDSARHERFKKARESLVET